MNEPINSPKFSIYLEKITHYYNLYGGGKSPRTVPKETCDSRPNDRCGGKDSYGNRCAIGKNEKCSTQSAVCSSKTKDECIIAEKAQECAYRQISDPGDPPAFECQAAA